jgi:hypothetical protein
VTEIDSGSPSRAQFWSDVETGAEWTRGRVRLDASVSSRPSIAGFQRAVWGRVTSTVSLSSRSSLVASVGTQPAELALSLPSARIATLGISVFPARRRPPPDAATTAAPSFVIRADSAGAYAATYHLANAHRVELSGDFDGWTPIEMRETRPGTWTASLPIAAGTYRMNVRTDGGRWEAPPGTTAIDDEFNGTVGIVVVR